MSIENYWELPEAKRARLTYEEVGAFADVELMMKGVKKPGELVLDPVPEYTPKTERYYVVGDVAFRNSDDVATFLLMRPLRVATDWSTGYDVEFVEPLTAPETVKNLPLRVDVLEHGRAHFIKRKATKTENDRRTAEHQKATREVAEALEAMWADWNACRAQLVRAEEVVRTFDRYCEIAKGDREIAAKFLHKTLGAVAIREAQTMTGETFECSPDGDPPTPPSVDRDVLPAKEAADGDPF